LIIPPLSEGNCYYWWSIIPKHFWVNINGTWGRDFIALKAINGNYLSCDCDNNLTADASTLGKDQYWIPVHISANIIALRSYHGGYLALHEDGTFDCQNRMLQHDQHMQVILTGGASNETVDGDPMYLLLQGLYGKYFGYNTALTLDFTFSNNGNYWSGAVTDSYIANNKNIDFTGQGEQIINNNNNQ
jgi:hypothetical protein